MQIEEPLEPLTAVRVANSEVELLGTAHVSKTSVSNVLARIESKEYDLVMVEICSRRHQSLMDPDTLAKLDLWQLIKQKKATGVIVTLALQGYQQRLADDLDTEAGAEIKAAIECANKHNIPLLLIDRDIGITMQRLMHMVRWWEKIFLFNSLFVSFFSQQEVDIKAQDIEAMKSSDYLSQMFENMGFAGKKIKQVLIDERDTYMSAKIIQAANTGQFKKAFVVVGAGHLAGMKRLLQQGINNVDEQFEQLKHVPPRGFLRKALPWIIVAVIVFGFIVGFSRNTELGMDLVVYWVLVNGGLSALGVVIAGGHWLTVIGAFFAAPLTSLNPTIGAGMVTAFIELSRRKPKVADFKELRKDTKTWAGWRHNLVARTLLVFFFSTLGSVLGTYLGGIYIFRNLM